MKCLAFFGLVIAVAAADYSNLQVDASASQHAFASNEPIFETTPASMPMPYRFAWAVKDQAAGNDYSHQADSDGNVVTGLYRVLLPDRRVQIVYYRADGNGYLAHVKYEPATKRR